jgi:PAS domain S-box-containing protein
LTELLPGVVEKARERQALIREKERADKTLRESEERYRLIANFTYDWEYWIGNDRRFLYVWPSCERITGYRSEEFLENHRLLDEITHPDDRARTRRHQEEEFNTERPCEFEFRILTRWGEERWINHACQEVRGAGGERMGRRGANRDITDRKRTEEKISHQNQELAKALEIVRQRQNELERLNRVLTDTNRGIVALNAELDEKARRRNFFHRGYRDWHCCRRPERIFEEYTQVHRSQQSVARGTGLGLSISRKLAHLLGGRIPVASTPGKGSVFSLELPLEALPPPENAVDRPAPAEK